MLGFFLLAGLALHLAEVVVAAVGLLPWKTDGAFLVRPVWREILGDALFLSLGILLWRAGRRRINLYVKNLLEWQQGTKARG
jgi:hypothetical protein